MKRITLLLIAILTCLAMATSQTDTDSIRPSVTDTRIEYTDTPANPDHTKSKGADSDEFFSHIRFKPEMAIPIIAIICVFGLPVLIVFIAFYFKYKNKKAKYKLAEQALAAGQPIPQEFFREKMEDRTLQKGITNIFTGIGLFIFLWAITEEFSIGCIGLLVMFMGFGQVMIHYTGNKKKEVKKTDNKDNNSIIEE